MATHDEKQAFAARLNLALKRSRKKISTPSELTVQFNLRYGGEPITPQAAQKWLSGQNRPSPDKIETLAAMLNVSYQWLRFGIPEVTPAKARPSSPSPATKQDALTPADLHLIASLRSLPEHQQHLVTEIVEQFALQQEMWQG
jgi:transcriptional regulator with XRE-family HTH domain